VQFPENAAAVDLGSNSFHMVVARTEDGAPVVVDRLREMVQLAAGLDEQRNLDRRAWDRGLACLERFGQRVRHMSRESVRAVGTNTLRIARNAPEFLVEAESALGHPIETISGMEEARLVYLGVNRSMPDVGGQRLVIDIGGGSTELVIGSTSEPVLMESLYMGCVSMSRNRFRDGSISVKRWDRAVLAARQELEPIRSSFRKLGWEQAVGASGTIRAVENIVRVAELGRDGITMKSLKRLRDEILAVEHVDELELEGLSSDRRAVFPGGVAILYAIFHSLGIDRMRHAAGALREGLLHDLIGRHGEEDVRAVSVASLGDRYHVDWQQAGRVECTALMLLGQVEQDWRLTSRDSRQLLSWAARLHEIGLDVAHAHYHKHGEYILGQSDLLGFSRDEQAMLATLVRTHRRKIPVSIFKSVPRGRRKEAERLAALLRLAVVLHRSRTPEEKLDPKLEVGKKSLRLKLPADWLTEHALTRADLETEAEHLTALGFELRFD